MTQISRNLQTYSSADDSQYTVCCLWAVFVFLINVAGPEKTSLIYTLNLIIFNLSNNSFFPNMVFKHKYHHIHRIS